MSKWCPAKRLETVWKPSRAGLFKRLPVWPPTTESAGVKWAKRGIPIRWQPIGINVTAKFAIAPNPDFDCSMNKMLLMMADACELGAFPVEKKGQRCW
jgi:hypothetical protein